MKDSTKISNSVAEIRQAAKTKKVSPLVIHIAKAMTGSNDRIEIYCWIDEHIGKSVTVDITKTS